MSESVLIHFPNNRISCVDGGSGEIAAEVMVDDTGRLDATTTATTTATTIATTTVYDNVQLIPASTMSLGNVPTGRLCCWGTRDEPL